MLNINKSARVFVVRALSAVTDENENVVAEPVSLHFLDTGGGTI